MIRSDETLIEFGYCINNELASAVRHEWLPTPMNHVVRM